MRIAVNGFGAAAQAGAVSGLLGGEGMIEEAHVFAPRTFCRARRPAEDAGARNAENERAVERGVAIDYGLPAAGFV